MIVIIGNKLPHRITGILRLWMIEIKSGVYVGNVNKKIEAKIMDFISPYLSLDSEIIVIRSTKTIQGFTINTNEKVCKNNGLFLFYNHIQ